MPWQGSQELGRPGEVQLTFQNQAGCCNFDMGNFTRLSSLQHCFMWGSTHIFQQLCAALSFHDASSIALISIVYPITRQTKSPTMYNSYCRAESNRQEGRMPADEERHCGQCGAVGWCFNWKTYLKQQHCERGRKEYMGLISNCKRNFSQEKQQIQKPRLWEQMCECKKHEMKVDWRLCRIFLIIVSGDHCAETWQDPVIVSQNTQTTG